MTHRSYIALGSNLDNPQKQVEQAVIAIAALGNILTQSPWYQSTAVGPGQQPDYINGVICLDTELDAHSLLAALQQIEQQQGRVRDVRWGARTLDLDILLFDDQLINSTTLQVPHPRISERHFVIWPLHDIAPQLIIPDGEPVTKLKARLSQQGLEKLPQTR